MSIILSPLSSLVLNVYYTESQLEEIKIQQILEAWGNKTLGLSLSGGLFRTLNYCKL